MGSISSPSRLTAGASQPSSHTSKCFSASKSAAELITQTAWREKEGRRAAQADSFTQSRDGARALAAAAKEASRKAKDREKSARKRAAKKAAEQAAEHASRADRTPGAVQNAAPSAVLTLVPATPTAPQGRAPARRRLAGAASSD